MKFEKDLRELNEREFKEIYKYLKRKTKNFSKIEPEVLKERPQLLFPIRLILGLSQFELGNKLNVEKQWVRHFETGRQGYKRSETLPKCITLINKSFSEKNILKFEETLKLFIRSKVAIEKWAYKYPEPKYELKRISEMQKEDFIKYFNILAKDTKNFTVFDTLKLIETPVFITVYRIILGLNLDQLCSLLNMQTRRIRKYERMEERMMPETAAYIMKIFEKEFRKQNLIGNVRLENSIKQFERLTPFDEIELRIKSMLEDNNFIVYFDENEIPNSYPKCAKIHANVSSARKDLNVDFIIPSVNNPLIAIEVTKLSERKRKDLVHRIAYLDHRFQLLKLKHEKIQTILVIECKNSQKDMIKKYIQREVVNTDKYLVNQTEKIIEIIKNIINTVYSDPSPTSSAFFSTRVVRDRRNIFYPSYS